MEYHIYWKLATAASSQGDVHLLCVWHINFRGCDWSRSSASEYVRRMLQRTDSNVATLSNSMRNLGGWAPHVSSSIWSSIWLDFINISYRRVETEKIQRKTVVKCISTYRIVSTALYKAVKKARTKIRSKASQARGHILNVLGSGKIALLELQMISGHEHYFQFRRMNELYPWLDEFSFYSGV